MRILFCSMMSIKILLLIFAIHNLYAMDTNKVTLKGDFECLPLEIIFRIALPDGQIHQNNTLYQHKQIAKKLSIANRCVQLNSFFYELLTPEIKKYINAYDRRKRTLLFKAIKNHTSLQQITTLIDQGADINKPNGQLSITPLTEAIRLNNIGIVRLLLEHGADVESGTTEIATLKPLARAIHVGNLEIAQLLIDYGAQLDNIHINSAQKSMSIFDYAKTIHYKDAIELIEQAIEKRKNN